MHDSALSALQPGTPGQWVSERIFPAKKLLLLKGVLLCFSTPSHFPFHPCNRCALVARQVLLDLFVQEKENKAYLGCLSPRSLGS